MANHVCPVWLGYFLASPLRKLLQNPDKILSPYVKPGMTALDIGSAMGFFTLPMARMVGPQGKIIAIDLQERMLQALQRRATKAGLTDRIETHQCPADSLGLKGLDGSIDFALAMAVVHEVPDPDRLFAELAIVLKPEGKVLLGEPKGHISARTFQQTIATAEKHGLASIESPRVGRSHAVVLRKP